MPNPNLNENVFLIELQLCFFGISDFNPECNGDSST